MPDIRAFFGSKDKAKTSPAPTVNKKKRLVISSDSSDDDVIDLSAQKKKRKTESPITNTVKNVTTKHSTAPTDFFGSSKVKQVKKEVKPVVRKPPQKEDDPDVKFEDFSDEEMFDDPAFMETLDKLDIKEKKQKENTTPPKESLSAKLAQKKGLSWKNKVGIANNQNLGKERVAMEESSATNRKRTRDTLDTESNAGVSRYTPIVSPVKKTPVRKSSNDSNKTPVRKSSSETKKTPVRKSSSETNKTPVRKSSTEKKKTPVRKTSSDSDKSAETPTKTDDTPKGKAGYWAYKNRAGPKNPGSKEIPVGADNCLEGTTFVLSGVLESLERDVAINLVQRYGGRVTSAVSRKTTYLVVGEECGVKKLEQAEKLHVKQIDEDGLLDLIRTKPAKKSSYDIKVEESVKKEKKEKKASEVIKKVKMDVETKSETTKQTTEKPADKNKMPASKSNASHSAAGSEPWTEKYRPKKVKEIIGQQGDKSNVKKLLNWLKNWSEWHKKGGKAPFNKDAGSHFKAALLSGSPGVGKTTSATVCCKELGFSFIEMNASDTRSKNSIKEHVANLLNNHTINGIMTKGMGQDKHVLIMDEVDGMAGNEDRGGIAELIQLIKSSRIPIICICNDRHAQKIRSLAAHCFDLRFYKPRLEQVKGAMMSIAFKEGLRIPPPAMQKIIEGANNDIRQILNNICLWSAGNKALSFDQASTEANKAKKDTNMSIFEIPRLFFHGGEETRRYSYGDYSELFFQDYSMTPFFIHENYLRSRPAAAHNNNLKLLKCVANAADSICFGDKVGAGIKMENWSLLPTQAHYSAIMPGFYMRGGLSGMVEFPKLLGQISKVNKFDNILQELLGHMSLHVTSDKRQLGMEYIPLLKSKLLTPLVKKETEGVSEVVDMMNCYDLQREDWDNIMELSTYTPNPNPATNVKTQVKSAFTRQYNKETHTTPYALDSAATKKRKTKSKGEEGGEEDQSGEEGDDDISAMIKPKTKRKAPAKKGEASKKRATKPKTSGKSKK